MEKNPDDDSEIDLFYVRNQEDGAESSTADAGDLDFRSVLERLEQKYSNLQSELSLVIDKKIGAQGSWDPEQRLVRITCDKQMKQFIPFTKDGHKFLLPFEALFLFECKSLALFHREMALSLEDAYQLILQDVREHKLFRVFAALARVGYYVRQFDIIEFDRETEAATEQSGCKRPLDSQEEYEQNKKIMEKKSEPTNNNNYCVINNIRQLKLQDVPKLDKIDRQLIEHFRPEEDSVPSSHLYCIKKASRPVPINRLLEPLFHYDKIKPLIPLGSIFNSENLFETIQNHSPMIYVTNTPGGKKSEPRSEIRIDFSVYSSRKFAKRAPPLFRVAVVDEDQPLPSIDAISQTISGQNNSGSPLFFAIMGPSLNFNFYSFETLQLENKYPGLWQRQL